MVFVDTSAWFAAVVPSDQNHPHAANWLATNPEVLITTDYIIDEILTLLRARGEHQRAKLLGKKFFDGSIAEIYFLTEEDIRQTSAVSTKDLVSIADPTLPRFGTDFIPRRFCRSFARTSEASDIR